MTTYAKLAEQPIISDLHMSDGTFVKSMLVQKAGTHIPQHSHAVSHTSFIATGAVRVWQDGKLLGDFTAPAGVLIEAKTKHLFLALQDNTTVLCIHRADLLEVLDEHQLDIEGDA